MFGFKFQSKLISKTLLILTVSFGFFCNLCNFQNQALASGEKNFTHGISVFGDLKYPKNFKNFDYVDVKAKKGGSVKFGVEGGFNSFNSFILSGLPAAGLSYLYDSLCESSADEISTCYGLVAQGIKYSKSENFIEFLLRPEAQFHDGVKITADDVIFTFKTLISKGHPSYKMVFRDVKDVKKISSHQVKFILSAKHNRELPLTIATLPVLPQHFYQDHDFSKTSLVAPLGSGPYKIKNFEVNRFITYEKVQNYWAQNLPVNVGRYNFSEITFDYYRDNQVLIEAFKAKKYDFRQENIARNWFNAYNIEAVKNGSIVKKEIPHALPAPMQAFVLNLRREKFQDLALRQALTYAFDFEWLKQRIFYGAYKRTKSYFANSEFGYQGFDLPQSQADGFNRENLLKAREILQKAGYKIHKGQLFSPKNEKIEMEFLIDSQAFVMVISPYLKNLTKLGIKAKMRLVEENQYQTRVNNFDYDVIVAVFPQSQIPGDELFAYFHSSQKDVKGSRNLAGISDKNIDEIVEKISAAKSKSELKMLCAELDEKLLKNYFLIPQWHNNSYRVLYRNIFEMPKIQPKYSLAVDSWWLK